MRGSSVGWFSHSTRYISGVLLFATHISPCGRPSGAESVARPIYEYGYPRRIPAGERLVAADDAGGHDLSSTLLILTCHQEQEQAVLSHGVQ
jgi:hypothetical protein